MIKKILGYFKDFYILLFIFSILYLIFNLNPISNHMYGVFSLYKNSEVYTDILKDEVNNISNKKQTFLLYDNSKEIKKNKEYREFRGEYVIEDIISTFEKFKKNDLLNKEHSKVKIENIENNIITKKEGYDDFFSLSSELLPSEYKYKDISYVVIPKIGVEAPIFYPDIELKDLEQEILKILEQGVVHRPETQLPYQKGNYFILGHSSNYPWIKSEYNNVFAKIDLLELGDYAYIYYKNRKYVYELYEKKIVDQNEISVYGYLPGRNLSIMTCYPIGSIKNRMIAKFKLITKKN